MQTPTTESSPMGHTSSRDHDGVAFTSRDGRHQPFEPRKIEVKRRADALGWFSLGLGLTQLVAPDALARLIGMPPSPATRSTMIALGLREMAAGVGILTQDQPRGWMWARVAGDVIDLALLGRAFTQPRDEGDNLALATAAVAGVLALDYFTARDLDSDRIRATVVDREKERIKKTESVTVNRSLEEVTRKWRAYEDAQQTGLDVQFAVAPSGKATELRAEHARLKGMAVKQELRHFKQVVETGEVVHSDASIHRGPHPGQPSKKKAKEVQR